MTTGPLPPSTTCKSVEPTVTVRCVSGMPSRLSGPIMRTLLYRDVLELLLVDRFVVCGARGDLAVLQKFADRRIHVDHAFLDAGLNGRRDLRCLSFADHVADG